MTKVRPPVSFELALTRVAGLVGWGRTAGILAVCERTARDWSEPDTQPSAGRSICLDAARDLDAAYRQAGGDGSPMLQCLALQLEIALAEQIPAAEHLALSAAAAARESGEAVDAVIRAALPGSGTADLVFAERQLEESIGAHTEALALVRASGGLTPNRRGPEVPPLGRREA